MPFASLELLCCVLETPLEKSVWDDGWSPNIEHWSSISIHHYWIFSTNRVFFLWYFVSSKQDISNSVDFDHGLNVFWCENALYLLIFLPFSGKKSLTSTAPSFYFSDIFIEIFAASISIYRCSRPEYKCLTFAVEESYSMTLASGVSKQWWKQDTPCLNSFSDQNATQEGCNIHCHFQALTWILQSQGRKGHADNQWKEIVPFIENMKDGGIPEHTLERS